MPGHESDYFGDDGTGEAWAGYDKMYRPLDGPQMTHVEAQEANMNSLSADIATYGLSRVCDVLDSIVTPSGVTEL